MNKLFSFAAGTICGALVGAAVVLLTTPASGDDLRANVNARIQLALSEARQAMEETRQAKEAEFEQMKQGR
ncbi:MAG: YtxH domain-containing protein [Ardenticatenaceae bacterium]|nr:YtxH domain-containing protein [Anaerolineales bacterium]MCB8918622.1 YtxH domain-containing protein [Ardenticatenaceae bacterium]